MIDYEDVMAEIRDGCFPLNIDGLFQWLSARRGRPIELLPAPIGTTAACGLLVSYDSLEYVVYSDTAGPGLRWHILLHEAAHLFFDDDGVHKEIADNSESEKVLTSLMPGLAPRTVLGRTNYDSDQEARAETLATFLAVECTSPDALLYARYENDPLGTLFAGRRKARR